MKAFVCAVAAVFLLATPALAQTATLEDQVAAQLAAQGIDPATADQSQIDAAVNSVLQAAIVAQAGGTSMAGLTDAQVAAAVGALVTNNPALSVATVAALTSAAATAKPTAAAAVAQSATAARPAAAVQITRAAVRAQPTQAAAIAAASSSAVVAAGGTTADVGAIVANAANAATQAGVPTTTNAVASTVSAQTGISAGAIETAANSSTVEGDDTIDTVEEVQDEIEVVEENPNQDASAS